MIQKAKSQLRKKKNIFACCKSSKKGEQNSRTFTQLDSRKKTLIILLEGSFTYNTTSSQRGIGRNITQKNKKFNVAKSLQNQFNTQNSQFSANQSRSSKHNKMRQLKESSMSSRRLLKIPIPLKQGDRKNLDVIIRPYSIDFINNVSLRYNIIMLTKASKYVRTFKNKLLLMKLVHKCCPISH